MVGGRYKDTADRVTNRMINVTDIAGIWIIPIFL
jgi:hypothetical protein